MLFPLRTTTAEIELGTTLQPKFRPDGLIPCITSDHAANEVLMFAVMKGESLTHTLRTKKATYWSRSRNKLWVKGEESGNTQLVKALLVDCDQDVILLQVDQSGPADASCPNGYKSCFYRKLANLDDPSLKLQFTTPRLFDPATVYNKKQELDRRPTLPIEVARQTRSRRSPVGLTLARTIGKSQVTNA